jgi:hypothetical protein
MRTACQSPCSGIRLETDRTDSLSRWSRPRRAFGNFFGATETERENPAQCALGRRKAAAETAPICKKPRKSGVLPAR